MSFTPIIVTATYELPNEGLAIGSVTFEPTAAMANGGIIVPAAPVTAALDGAGGAGFYLDDPANLDNERFDV